MEEYWVAYGEPKKYQIEHGTEDRERADRLQKKHNLKTSMCGGIKYYRCPQEGCRCEYISATAAVRCCSKEKEEHLERRRQWYRDNAERHKGLQSVARVECYGETDKAAKFVSLKRIWELTGGKSASNMHNHVRTWLFRRGLELTLLGFTAADGCTKGMNRDEFYKHLDKRLAVNK